MLLFCKILISSATYKVSSLLQGRLLLWRAQQVPNWRWRPPLPAASVPVVPAGPSPLPTCSSAGRSPLGVNLSSLQSELSSNITELQPAIDATLHEPGQQGSIIMISTWKHLQYWSTKLQYPSRYMFWMPKLKNLWYQSSQIWKKIHLISKILWYWVVHIIYQISAIFHFWVLQYRILLYY